MLQEAFGANSMEGSAVERQALCGSYDKSGGGRMFATPLTSGRNHRLTNVDANCRSLWPYSLRNRTHIFASPASHIKSSFS